MINGAEIQVENGNYSRIHNAILEAIYGGDFTARELKCLLFLLRKTYGYSKKSDAISYEQFAAATGIARRHVMATMQGLAAKNVVIVESNGQNRPQSWTFNKYIEQWELVTKTVTTTSDQNSHQIDKLVTKTVTTLVTESVTTTSDQNSHPQKKEKDTSKESIYTYSNGTNGDAPKPKRERSDKQKAQDAWVESLAYALEFDLKIPGAYGRWAKTGAGYERAGYTPEDVRTWKEFVWPTDWRHDKGQKPTKSAMDEMLPDIKRRREAATAPKRTQPKVTRINMNGKPTDAIEYPDGKVEYREVMG